MSNTSTSIAFSGDIPAHYDAGLGPMFFEPFALDLADRVGRLKPRRILELACGTGRVTKLLRTVAVPGASLTATDINPAMVRHARLLAHDPEIRWQEADATALPFPDASYDCIVVGFGVMFYSDRGKAYAEALRVLRPGGTMLFTAWDAIVHNPMARLAHETLAHFFPDNTPGFYSVPFAYHDEHLIRLELHQAGFREIEVDVRQLTGYQHSAMHAAAGLIRGTPAITAIEERDPAKVAPIMAHLEQQITDRFGAYSLEVPLQARVVSARKPA
jgi:ubiquinone/menaquinone biosynthesis C-methylase UbiE